jgi:membrane protease YdiL (CAAX protease family)
VAFAAVHQNWGVLLPLTIMGLFQVMLYERTDNLLAPITAHALFNGINVFYFYLGEYLNRHMGGG